MELLPKLPSAKGSADRFTGDVWLDVIPQGRGDSRIRVSVVRFAPASRNAWHAHSLGQVLHVIEGVGRVQARGGAVTEMRAGDTVYTPPGEWHWHGAAPDHFMTHIAMWEVPTDGPESEWGEQVLDADYQAMPTDPDA